LARLAGVGARGALSIVLFASGCAAAGSSAVRSQATIAVTPGSTSTPARTQVPTPSPTPEASPTPGTEPVTFTSPIYGYSITLPAGWTIVAAQVAWDGTSAPGHQDSDVDQLIGPEVSGRCSHIFLCGPVAWALAGSTTKSLADYAAERDSVGVANNGCAEPETSAPTTIGGEAALVEATHCPADGGILVLSAFTVQSGIGFGFYLQEPSGDPAVEPEDRSDFAAMLATVQLP
jgi:hypothetical protein